MCFAVILHYFSFDTNNSIRDMAVIVKDAMGNPPTKNPPIPTTNIPLAKDLTK